MSEGNGKPVQGWFVMENAFALELAKLDGSRARAILAMAPNADHKTGDNCWLSLRTIQERTGLDRSTVIRALKELEQKGLVKRYPKPGRTDTFSLVGVGTRRMDATGKHRTGFIHATGTGRTDATDPSHGRNGGGGTHATQPVPVPGSGTRVAAPGAASLEDLVSLAQSRGLYAMSDKQLRDTLKSWIAARRSSDAVEQALRQPGIDGLDIKDLYKQDVKKAPQASKPRRKADPGCGKCDGKGKLDHPEGHQVPCRCTDPEAAARPAAIS